jgi:hypothetical protein
MNRVFLLLMVSMFLFLFTACNDDNSVTIRGKEVTHINLSCTNLTNQTGCVNKSFADIQAFHIFKEAIESAKKMSGILNYAAEYKLKITFKDNTTTTFDLSLGSNKEMKGLLVDLADRDQGYEISNSNANKLRDLIIK